MTDQNVKKGSVRTSYTVRLELNALHDGNGKKGHSWREISQLPKYLGITPTNLCAIAKGREPVDPVVRLKLGLPALAPAPVCVKCGEVHTTRRCTKNLTGKPRNKPIPWEHYEQVAMFNLFEVLTPQYPELAFAFAVPNGGLRNKITAKKLKAEGVKAGVLDVWLPAPRQGYTGLVMELKVRGNTTTPEQVAWLEFLRSEGWLAVVLDSADLGAELATAYLAGVSNGGREFQQVLWETQGRGAPRPYEEEVEVLHESGR